MRGSARLGDQVAGECRGPGHGTVQTTGRIVTASSDVIVNDRAVARIGDKVQLECPLAHMAVIVTSSPDVTSNRLHARLGDKVAGEGSVNFDGEIVTASPDVFVN